MKQGIKIRKFNASPVQDFNTANKLYVDNKISIGDLKHSIKSDDHAEWLKCDGRSLNRSDYPELFGVIGTSFGNLSGTTFNLPDARGRVLGSVGTGTGLTARSIGQNVGSETHTLTTAEMPNHTHTGTTDSSGSHTHTSNANGGQGGNGLITADGLATQAGGLDSSLGEPNLNTLPIALSINSSGTHTHNFTTGSIGGGGAHNIMQPTLFIGNVFILSKTYSYDD